MLETIIAVIIGIIVAPIVIFLTSLLLKIGAAIIFFLIAALIVEIDERKQPGSKKQTWLDKFLYGDEDS